MSNKMLFGKSLTEYDNDDIDELLSKLTDDEIRELNEEVDPDNALLPPSQRCRNQTDREPTGRYDREKLIRFLIEKAKNEADWNESVPFESKVRGKIFAKKQEVVQLSSKELADMGFDVEFDETVNEALASATEDELVDLAAVLGFTGMMNQVQFHASLENRTVEGGGFTSVAKAEKPKIIPDEPPNTTNVEESITKMSEGNADLKVLNLNNIKTMSAEVVSRLATALGENTHLTELHMASTHLTSSMVEPLLLALKVNHTLKTLNLESNFITGEMILQLLEAVAGNKSAVIHLRLANQRQTVLGIKTEQELSKLLMSNPRLQVLGVDLDTADARIRVREHLKENIDKATRQLRKNPG